MKYVEASKNVFMNTGSRFHPAVVWSVALVKKSAAEANIRLGLLDSGIGDSIIKASEELMEGRYLDRITVDVFQTGSGTGINMNVNELVAEIASNISGKKVHPNDHVNMGQSSNDVVPSAIRIAAVKILQDKLKPAINSLVKSLEDASKKWAKTYKAGRTHLRDALPVTLGQELGAYADAFRKDLAQIERAVDYVRELPIGGTAVGTGLNTHPDYPRLIVDNINAQTGLNFRIASNKFSC